MKIQSIDLIWIVVKDFKQAVNFYTQVVGLTLLEMNEEWGWAELQGADGKGIRLGIAKQNLASHNPDPIQPGQNAIITMSVENLETANQHFLKSGATLIGTVQEIPGHVKLQTLQDLDGNYFQIAQSLN